jgi:hypothetical protein
MDSGDRMRLHVDEMEIDPKELRKAVCSYWQVSLPVEPFTADLEPPEERLWPLGAPEGFTDEEVIEIVDFIRTSPQKEPHYVRSPDGSIGSGFYYHIDGKLPIMGMHREQDGTIVVTTGSVQGPLAGHGQEIRLRRETNRFIVLEVGEWYA